MSRHASLNHIYRLVWSQVLSAWVAVAETTKGRGKASSRSKLLIAASFLLGLTGLPNALAGPIGGQVTAGDGTISQIGNTTVVHQSSQKLSINWADFSIPANEAVRFNQPNSSSIVLNRILGQSVTQIYGALSANGQVFILNPNGVLFGNGAQVNVGGFVASTLSLSNDDFMAGKFSFSNNGNSGSVINHGNVTASQGGYIAMLAPQVINDGVISATLGKAVLAAGNQVTLNIAQGSLVGFSIDKGAFQALIDNKQLIEADGGQIYMSAKAADMITKSMVNNTGIVEARTLANINGRIEMIADRQGGVVNVGGTLDASAPNGGDGGFIETSAATVHVANGAHVTASAPSGNTGSWLIDPTDFTITDGDLDQTASGMGANTLQSALNAGNVIIETSVDGSDAGNINVNAPFSWSTPNSLMLSAYNNININQSITSTHEIGKLVLLYGQGASDGVINGTLATYHVNAAINLHSGSNFSTRLGSAETGLKEFYVITSLGDEGSASSQDLQGINGGLSQNYALGANIDASATAGWASGFAPLGQGYTSQFTGAFDGLGHTITGLTINQPSQNFVGLFGYAQKADIRNVGLVNVNLSGMNNVGALVGFANNSLITNSYSTGSVIASGNYVGGLVGRSSQVAIDATYSAADVSGVDFVGGLVGQNYGNSSIINNSHATGNVSSSINYEALGGSYTSRVGGLVGSNYGTINNSSASGNVSSSIRVTSATNDVNGINKVGGLVGLNYGGITNSHATGNVSSNIYFTGEGSVKVGALEFVGGLVGSSGSGGFIQNSYATGNVAAYIDISANGATTMSGSAKVGGLVGWNGVNFNSDLALNNVQDSYATGNVSGIVSIDAPSSQSDSVFGHAKVGGLIGFNGSVNGSAYNDITRSYATGNVSGSLTVNINYGYGPPVRGGELMAVGGLVGFNGSYGNNSISRIAESHATGSVLRRKDGNYFSYGAFGGLVGSNGSYGSISNSYATGNVFGSGYGFTKVGGLVGSNYGSISNSYATGNVSGSGDGAIKVGGLVGVNYGSISNSYATGNVSGSGYGLTKVGGLVGYNEGGSITNSYATGTVSGYGYGKLGNLVGGLVGSNYGSISNSYATGAVSIYGYGNVGGLVGYNDTYASISNSFWDSVTTGANYGVGLDYGTTTNLTSVDASTRFSLSTYQSAGWNFGSSPNSGTWFMIDGETRPFLQSEYSTTITNAHQLQLMSMDLGAHYTLSNNIDMTSEFNNVSGMWATDRGVSFGSGFVPVGTDGTHFTGTFDGLGHTISGLTINRPSLGGVGLFGYGAGTIGNVGLLNVSIVGDGGAGALVGSNYGDISHSYSTGSVEGVNNDVGGLVGNNRGTISYSYSSASVNSSFHVGGLVGHNSGLITGSYATGDVGSVDGVGGLVGYNYGSITNSYATGNVSGSGYGNNVGGLVGDNGGSISNSYATGNVSVLANNNNIQDSNYGSYYGSYVGGLVGYNDGSISNSYATGNVSVSANNNSIGNLGDISVIAGGLVGYNYNGSISNSYATGSVSALANYNSLSGIYSKVSAIAGGLVGYNYNGSISNSYATGSVSASATGNSILGYGSNSSAAAGGLVGWNSGSISNTYATGAVSIYGYGNVGGLVGINYGSISNSFWDTDTTGQGSPVGAYHGYGYSEYLTSVEASTRFSLSTYQSAGWNFGSSPNSGTWFMIDGETRPFLQSEYSTTITNAHQLQLMSMDLGAHYTLSNNIDMTSEFNNVSGMWATDRGVSFGSGFVPVGTDGTHFTGTFDGLGHTISGLTINRPSLGGVGLFGYGQGISNVGLLNVDITGGYYVGGLAGNNYGSITNSYVTGRVVGRGSVGGLVGWSSSDGMISNSYSTAAVSGTDSDIGGLVGDNEGGSITNSYATGAVSGYGNVGGLVGSNYGSISNSYATGNVSGSGYGLTKVGGLVGDNEGGSISNSYATGAVSGYGNVGGLVGSNYGSISNSYATGAVSIYGYGNVGGLVGYNDTYASISNSFWDSVTTGANYGVGLDYGTTTNLTSVDASTRFSLSTYQSAGWNFGSSPNSGTWFMIDGETRPFLQSEYSTTITNAHQLQLMSMDLGAHYTLSNNIDMTSEFNNVSGMWATDRGVSFGSGFVPVGTDGTHFTGTFDGLGHTISGLTINRPSLGGVGLFGYGQGISNVGLLNVDITGGYYVGGLAGNNYGSITNSYVTGRVVGRGSVGGLVGWSSSDGMISNSYSTAAVSGTDSDIGGLVGDNEGGSITNSYATGAVSGYGNVGGLVGSNYGSISNSYATGAVSIYGYGNVGGLVGYNDTYASISNSFWDSVTTGANYGVGLDYGTTTNLTSVDASTRFSLSTYQSAGWNFGSSPNSGTWFMIDGETRPFLQSEYSTTITNAHQLQLMSMDLGAHYTLSNNIDMTSEFNNVSGMWATDRGVSFGSGFVPVGTDGTHFTGTFDGLGHTISGLTINRPSLGGVGLFGYGAGTIGNVGLLNVSIVGDGGAGALVGSNYGDISHSYSTGSVEGVNNDVGGLVGNNRGTISYSYSSASVNSSFHVGGLVGHNSGLITGSYATGDVGSVDGVGGLVGYNYGSITNSYATGNVSGSGYGNNVGGLVGDNGGSISNSYATGNVSVLANNNNIQDSNYGSYYGSYVGGLVGYNDGSISNSYATGNVSVSANNNSIGNLGDISVIAGGLVGYNYNGSISNSYATGSVSALANYNSLSGIYSKVSAIAGGLVGYNYNGSISNSYATGSVSASATGNSILGYGSNSSAAAGGLVGWNSGSISNTYATGAVSIYGYGNVGGLVGINYGSISNSFWDTDTTGQGSPVGAYHGYGYSEYLTSVEASTRFSLSTYQSAGWNFGSSPNSGTWFMIDGETRPFLQSEYSTTITNAHQLQLMSMDLGAHYTLSNNIDMTSEFNNVSGMWATDRGVSFGSGFVPVGTDGTHFTGTFDGLGHTISGLTINRPSLGGVGLFGYGQGISNVGLLNVDITGGYYVGGLAGNNYGSITNSYVTGRVVGRGSVGGLVGWSSSDGMISNSYSTAAVSGTDSDIGGLVGDNEGGSITNSYATGAVSGYGNVGGLVGSNYGSISNSYATGNVSGSGYGLTKVGGLVGDNEGGSISNSYATGAVSGYGNVGGLVGSNYGSISNSYATGAVSIYGYGNVGGLVGYNYNGSISNSYATGNVSGSGYGNINVGGLVGYNNNYGSISNSYATGNVSGSGYGNINVGGLVGYNYNGSISNSYATGNVSGSGYGNINVGGLVGYNNNYGSISNSYATGNVSVSANDNILNAYGYISAVAGGLVGSNYGSISNSYATGNVSVSANDNILNAYGYIFAVAGGLVGSNYGTISNSYSTGNVSVSANGTVGENHDISAVAGGLVGINWGTLSNSFYDIEAVSVNGSESGKINGSWVITIGGIFDNQYQNWIAHNFVLSASEYFNIDSSDGTYLVSSINDLKNVLGFAENSGYHFKQTVDLDLSSDSGLYIPYFNGNYDGAEHTIENVVINMPQNNKVGFFGELRGNLENISLVNASVSGNNYVGGLVGSGYGNTISNSYVIGNVSGNNYVGGLVGSGYGNTISNSYVIGNVSGNNYVGGLVGSGYGNTISNSYVIGNNVSGNNYVGGLVGQSNNAVITDSYATIDVAGNDYVGGLVGESLAYLNGYRPNSAYASISNSYASGNVSGHDYVGGLVGQSRSEVTYYYWASPLENQVVSSTISDSYATGNVFGHDYVGGLVGVNVSNLYLYGNNINSISIQGNVIAATITNSLATGVVVGNFQVGGLVGSNRTGFDGQDVGSSPMVDHNTIGASISLSSATGDVTGDYQVGGLVGLNNYTATLGYQESNLFIPSIAQSYAQGNVLSVVTAGGLVGANYGSIESSFATGNALGHSYVGGLVGYGLGSIVNSYATGNVSGNDYVGGLAGWNSGSIGNSYATGNVSGNDYVGGLLGYNYGSISNSYWNVETSGQVSEIGSNYGSEHGIVGLTTSEMHSLSSFSAWGSDINSNGTPRVTWRIYEGHTSPLLTGFMSEYALNDVIATYNGAVQTGQIVDGDPNLLGSAASGKDVGNYQGYYSTQFGYNILGGNLTITQKTITQSGLSVASSKVYDGSRSAAVLGVAALTTEEVGTGTASDGIAYVGDDVSLAGTATGTYNTKDVSTASSVAFGGLSLTGAASGNYVLAMQADAAATITQKTITQSGLSVASSKVYDGSRSAAVLGVAALTTEEVGTGTASDGIAYVGDDVSLAGTATGTYNTKDVSTASSVAFGGLSLTGAASGNYVLAMQADAAATITQKTITQSGLSVASSKVYDGSRSAAVLGVAALTTEEVGTGTASDGIAYVGDDVSLAGTATGTYNTKDVSTASSVAFGGLSLTGAASGNYVLAMQADAAATITQKTITQSGLSVASSKVYDGSRSAAVLGVAALTTEEVGTGTASDGIAYVGDDVSLAGTATGTYNTKDVSTASSVAFGGLSLTGAASGNYVLAMQADAAATITQKTITQSGLSVASSKVYDGSRSAAVLGVAALTTEEVGTGTASDGIAYVGDDVSLAGTATGTYNTKDVSTASSVAFGGLSLTGAASGNYVLAMQADAAATITQKTITQSGLSVASSKVYDGSRSAAVLGVAALTTEEVGTGTASDGIAYVGDDVSLAGTATGTYNTKDVSTASSVAFGGLSLTGAASGNYVLAMQADAAATITQKTITQSGLSVASSKVYDGSRSAAVLGVAALTTEEVGTGTASDGIAYVGDDVSLAGTATGTYNTKDVSTASSVAFGGLSLTGAASGNYVLAMQADAAATITQKTITQSGLSVASSKVYDGSRSAAVLGVAALTTEEVGTGTASDGIAYVGDDVSLAGTATGTYNTKDVSTASSVAFGGLSLTGAASGNYVLAMQADAAATITKADAVVTANSARRYYNGATQTVTGFTVSGLVGSETSDVLTSVIALGTGIEVGQYPVVASGNDANYNLSFIEGILSIQKQNTSPALNAVAAMFASQSKQSQYTATPQTYQTVNLNQSIADNIKLPDNMLTALPGDENIKLCCSD